GPAYTTFPSATISVPFETGGSPGIAYRITFRKTSGSFLAAAGCPPVRPVRYALSTTTAITTGPVEPARADHLIQTSQGVRGVRFPRCTRFQTRRPGVSSGEYRCPGPTHVARPRRAAPMSFKMQRVHVYDAEVEDKP